MLERPLSTAEWRASVESFSPQCPPFKNDDDERPNDDDATESQKRKKKKKYNI
jgi:hypothetical protein